MRVLAAHHRCSLSPSLSNYLSHTHKQINRVKKCWPLTRFILQRMRISRAQKKTAMTPVPISITISTLALSLDPLDERKRKVTAAGFFF